MRTRIRIKTSKREKKAAVVREVTISILTLKAESSPKTLLQYLVFFFCLAATPHFVTHAHNFAEVAYNIAYFSAIIDAQLAFTNHSDSRFSLLFLRPQFKALLSPTKELASSRCPPTPTPTVRRFAISLISVPIVAAPSWWLSTPGLATLGTTQWHCECECSPGAQDVCHGLSKPRLPVVRQCSIL